MLMDLGSSEPEAGSNSLRDREAKRHSSSDGLGAILCFSASHGLKNLKILEAVTCMSFEQAGETMLNPQLETEIQHT